MAFKIIGRIILILKTNVIDINLDILIEKIKAFETRTSNRPNKLISYGFLNPIPFFLVERINLRSYNNR